MLECDGVEMYQSDAMLKWIGRMGDGALFPCDDPAMLFKIEEMLGLGGDFSRAWMPCLYIGMRHTAYGHPEKWDDKAKVVQEMREKFVADELPKYMAFFTNELEKSGGFLCGPKPTIADCAIYPQLHYFQRGVADHVPKECLDGYPVVIAWLARFRALPELQKHYGA